MDAAEERVPRLARKASPEAKKCRQARLTAPPARAMRATVGNGAAHRDTLPRARPRL